jgi:hypothetical protein
MPSGIPDFHRLGDPEAEVLLDAPMRALMSHAPGWVDMGLFDKTSDKLKEKQAA